MKKILKLISAFALIAALAVSCKDPDKNTEDGKYLDPTSGFEDQPVGQSGPIQEGVEKYDNPYLSWVRVFPGFVPDSIYRYVDGIAKTINMNYTPTSDVFRHSHYGENEVPIFYTGLYAPPGEVIRIERPAGSPNVRVIIGTSDRLSVTDGDTGLPVSMQRYPEIVVRKNFTSGDVLVIDSLDNHYFGGPVFIQPLQGGSNPPLGQTGEVTYKFYGVVKPANFVKGETDIDEWIEQLETVEVPMIEVVTDRIIWQMPLRDARTALRGSGSVRPMNAQNFARLVEWYDDITVNDFYAFNGLVVDDPASIHRAPDFQLRNMADIQISAGAAHSGYPAMYGGSTYSVNALLYDRMITGNAWGFFHEIGHNLQMTAWTWNPGADPASPPLALGDGNGNGNGVGEVNNNLFILHSMTRLHNDWGDPDGVMLLTAQNFAAVEDQYKNFALATNDAVYTPLANVLNGNGNYPRLTPFAQLAQRYGWRLFAYLSRSIRELSSDDYQKVVSVPNRRPFFILRACEYAQTDLRPFFDDWGMKYPMGVRLAIMQAGFPNTLDKANDPWWHTFNYGVIPSFETRDVSTGVKIDNEVIWNSISGPVDRANWIVTTSPLNAGAGSNPNNLIDGTPTAPNVATVINLTKGDDVNFVIDLGAEAVFNTVLFTNGGTATSAVAVAQRAHEFSVYGSLDGTDYTLIKSGIRPNSATNNATRQTFNLGDICVYRYVKVTVDDYAPMTSAANNMVQIADFGLSVVD